MRSQSSDGTAQSILIGSVLIIPNIVWLVNTELIWAVYPTWLTLFPNVVSILFVYSLLLVLLKRRPPRPSLPSKKLAIIYVMLSVSTAVFGRDTMRIIFHYIGAAHFYATPENDWAALFWKYLPDWLTVSDQKALDAFYRGSEHFHYLDYIRVWARPLLIWGFFVLTAMFVTACMISIVRKQSMEYEHLSYPIIQLPLRMIVDRRMFLSNKLMWIGFAIAGGIEVLNGLHFLYPAVPGFRLRTDIGRFFTERPWNAMGQTRVCFYPFAAGFSYIMPLNLSFSCWLFYLLLKAQLVLRSVLGFRVVSYVPYLGHQAAGAWLCIGVTWMWTARRHIAHVCLVAIGKREADDANEAISYRTVVPALILALAVLVAFVVRAGMAIWVAVSFLLLYFMISLGVARMRAQLGPPTHDIDHVGPEEFLIGFIGTRRIGPRSLSLLPLFSWLGSWNYRGLPIGHQLEGLKIAEEARVSSRRMFVAIMLAVGLTVLIGPFIYSHYAHKIGISVSRSSHLSRYLYRRLENRLLSPSGPSVPTAVEISIGFGITLLLSAVQRLFLFWPLHPLGYAISSGSYIMSWIWFSIFIGWLLKMVILKYGGLRLYRRASFLFLGMLLGQYMIGSLWALLATVFDKQMYGFFP